MLTNGQLHEILAAVSLRHNSLKAKFAEFAKHLETALPKDDYLVKGISVKTVLESDYVELRFAGRVLKFVFTSLVPEAQHKLVGSVQCYLVVDTPERKLVEVGGFTFKPSGESDIKPPPDNDPIHVNFDTSALYIALNLIHEALSK